MIIDPELAALRGDHAAQRTAQAALEGARAGWRDDPRWTGIAAELGRWGQGGALADCPTLSRLVGSDGEAGAFVDALVAAQLDALAVHPLGQVPFRHQLSEGLAILQLASLGPATLSLIAYEERAGQGEESAICFSDGERHEVVLAGFAEAEILTIAEESANAARFVRERIALRAGDRLHLDGASVAKRLLRIAGRIVVLRLSRTPDRPGPTRQFEIASGRLLHRSSGDRRESRDELAMAVIGRMRRVAAAPVLAALSAGEGSDHFRWQALRECLALDTGAGFAALSRIARDAADPLAHPAAALQAQLIETYPQLVEIEESEPCLAD